MSFKEAMLYDWSRDSALAAIQAASKAASLSGSRNGTTGTGRGRLGLNGALTNGNHKADSPFQSTADLRPRSQPGMDVGRLAPLNAIIRKSSVRSAVSGKPDSVTGGPFVTSISHLRMVLNGEIEAPPLTAGGVHDGSSSDESMVSYDPSNSDVSFNPPPPATASSGFEGSVRSRSISHERKGSDGASLGPLNSHPPSNIPEDDDGYVPPVPPIPSGVVGSTTPPSGTAAHDYAVSPTSTSRRQSKHRSSIKSRGGSSTWSGIQASDEPLPTMDLQSLLKGIDSRAGEGSLGNLTRPPY